MTVDEKTKELVKRLRVNMHAYGIAQQAADALEAMAGDVEAYESARVTWAEHMRAWINRTTAAEAERDRLKAALEDIDAVAVDFGYYEAAARTMKEIALKALRAAGDGR